MAKICIIVPVYNVEKYLKRCLDSILNQTFIDFELVLVDNASTDSSPQICDDYSQKDNRVIVIHETQKFGAGHGRNLGLNWLFKNSDCEYIAHIDSDDWVASNYLESLYNVIVDTDSDISMCEYKNSSIYPIKFDENPEKYLPTTYTDTETFFCNFAEYGMSLWGKLYKRELYKGIVFPQSGVDDGRVTYQVVFKARKISCFPAVLYCYFNNIGSYTKTVYNVEKSIDLCDSLLCQVDYFYENNYPKAYSVAFERYCRYIHYFIVFNQNNKDFNEFKKEQMKNIKDTIKKHSDMLSVEEHNNIAKLCIVKAKRRYKKACVKYFKSDINNIKATKGYFFSILWCCKNIFKIKKMY